MMVGENIHNAFVVVFKTLQEIEKLIGKCRTELDTKKYYMPAERFMRYSSDQTWEGWIYWSFILLFQRLDDGSVMENGWIDGPVYAVEINVDSDTCDVPKVYIAKMQFDRMKDWTKGCSPSNHSLFYNAIHGNSWTPFWGLQKLEKQEHDLTDLTQKNYKAVSYTHLTLPTT